MSQTLLELQGLVKRYGGLVATDHLSLSVKAGQTHAIIGPNGAGKTTLIQQIAGGLRPNEGTIRFDGQDITVLPMHKRVQRGLARSYQITNIFKSCSVLDNLALAVQARSGSSMRFWRPALSDSAIFDEARELADTVGLSTRVDAIASNLAHGAQRQLEVGLALATRPRMLLLDEPMAGMGHGESLQLVELINRLRGQVTILLIEHDMEAVFQLAECISVLVFGRIIASGNADEIRSNAEVKKAYLGDEVAA
ncbi:ABC transporter ATP-binding protein [Eoetvoesiella caeni]|uniref:Amino acid/amide ABC transporter ATP-binding protein 1 (HAAT family) n=1 Tax=Eoetvoesiella caeni TaxID=645616 RepID=A0A366HJB5_9BURK|nr:ABC transporter ATP-binding protein [Eoetvoesiella caeni]MCI2807638.1 ABC transporter ATP-binding protein [Eoetvoesiella caeni]NYT52967.1 ABC transporter ATP-binding protein [Eoetvoesiella caeni]RBP42944.1 amino acid/amide ABC transporter ATP-binding protein 1 (HAAT family) [Eoetvoesiella caeni]